MGTKCRIIYSSPSSSALWWIVNGPVTDLSHGSELTYAML